LKPALGKLGEVGHCSYEKGKRLYIGEKRMAQANPKSSNEVKQPRKEGGGAIFDDYLMWGSDKKKREK